MSKTKESEKESQSRFSSTIGDNANEIKRTVVVSLLIVLFVVVTLPLYVGISPTFASYVTNTVLTIFLIWIYSQILAAEEEQTDMEGQVVEIQERQSEILENQQQAMDLQTRLMRVTFEPEIVLRSADFIGSGENSAKSVISNPLNIVLENIGNGFARNVRIIANISIKDEKYVGVEREVSTMRFHKWPREGKEEVGGGVASGDNDNEYDRWLGQDYLFSGERAIFSGSIYVHVNDKGAGKSLRGNFDHIAYKLYCAGVNKVRPNISIRYDDVLAESKEIDVLNPPNYYDLREFFNRGLSSNEEDLSFWDASVLCRIAVFGRGELHAEYEEDSLFEEMPELRELDEDVRDHRHRELRQIYGPIPDRD